MRRLNWKIASLVLSCLAVLALPCHIAWSGCYGKKSCKGWYDEYYCCVDVMWHDALDTSVSGDYEAGVGECGDEYESVIENCDTPTGNWCGDPMARLCQGS